MLGQFQRFSPPSAFLTYYLRISAASLFAAPQQESGQIMPLSEVRGGMQGYAYTIFAGDQIEKFGSEVIGVMPISWGPSVSIILVELKGPKVEHTGVVAGMSGSPVYLEGKLAGALPLNLAYSPRSDCAYANEDVLRPPTQSAEGQTVPQQFTLPNDTLARNSLPSGSSLERIETPLIFPASSLLRWNNSRRNSDTRIRSRTRRNRSARAG